MKEFLLGCAHGLFIVACMALGLYSSQVNAQTVKDLTILQNGGQEVFSVSGTTVVNPPCESNSNVLCFNHSISYARPKDVNTIIVYAYDASGQKYKARWEKVK